jgi:hypothetical protein
VKKSFSSPDETKKPFAKGTIESVIIGGLDLARETLEPGHDAWVVGDEPNVLLELSGATKPSELSGD